MFLKNSRHKIESSQRLSPCRDPVVDCVAQARILSADLLFFLDFTRFPLVQALELAHVQLGHSEVAKLVHRRGRDLVADQLELAFQGLRVQILAVRVLWVYI